MFDVYIPFSLKEAVPTSRGVALSVLVKGTTKIRSWLRFLKNDANKQSLFQHIASYAACTSVPLGKQLVITCLGNVITNPHRDYINIELSPCNHEEVDTRMILHIEDILISGKSVVMRTVDTDVLVLAIAASIRHENKEIWVWVVQVVTKRLEVQTISELQLGMKKLLRYLYSMHFPAVIPFHPLIGWEADCLAEVE